ALVAELAAIVRGDSIDPALFQRCTPGELSHCAAHHGVVALLCDRLADAARVPPEVRAELRTLAARAPATDLRREAELRGALGLLVASNVPFLVVKGSQLASSHYPRPDLRPRVDTDIVIADPSGLETVAELLGRLGYVRRGEMSGSLVMSQ